VLSNPDPIAPPLAVAQPLLPLGSPGPGPHAKVGSDPGTVLPPRQQLELFSKTGQSPRPVPAAEPAAAMSPTSAVSPSGDGPPAPLDPSGEIRTMVKKATTAPKQASSPARSRGDGGGRGAGGGGAGGSGSGGNGPNNHGETDASLEAEARRRYLNYALSVITARALPDVRDGLKPVQRRILFAMLNDEHLRPDAKHRKSAKVVGAVIGRYHPHGDTAVYDAMVRMAQDFTLHLPLVDGSGNFGSLDGDAPAAYRYTECRLAPPAMQLLDELKYDTVEMRPNYDGTAEEPAVLPARFPNLLVNGSTGIAVGMATNIPPHNLAEVTNAAIALAEDPTLTHAALMKHIKGPDFPTGGQLLNTKEELSQIYKDGHGPIRIRGHHTEEKKPRGGIDIVITSIPYGLTKSDLVEKIAEVIISRKLPYLLDVRDESTTDVRIVLEIKRDADPAMVMAYLYKHTPLQHNFHVNITCLVPPEYLPENQGKTVPPGTPAQPRRMGIKEVLEHFLRFREEVTRKLFTYQLAQLRARIHVLEGFVTIFDALDETIRIIRASDGKADAAAKIMKKFGLDELQVEAVLELRLYKLAKLEIRVIREELDAKATEARRIEGILKSETKLWGVIKDELRASVEQLDIKRRTKAPGREVMEELEFDADAFIIDEDANVVVTRDNWIKRVREIKDPAQTRTREGDEVTYVLPGSTKEKVIFFTNRGSAYVVKINDIAATTGYGDPAQKYFKFSDGEKIVAAMTLDPRALVPPMLLAVTRRGYGLRFAMAAHQEVTTKVGRRYAKPQESDEVLGVVACNDGDTVVTATAKGHVLVCKADEIAKLEGPGRGVIVLKTDDDDAVIGFVAGGKADKLVVESDKGGKRFELAADPKAAAARGGKGGQIVKKATLVAVPKPVTIPPLANADGGSGVN
jgi:DNA gyrase subunit A